MRNAASCAARQESRRPLHDRALLLQRAARARRRAPDRRGRGARSRRALRQRSGAASIRRTAPSPIARIKEPMELTSRVSTDEVAQAKQRLDAVFGRDAEPVDVALATNMISVGLDIPRLGLMVVQGQPKTAAEYIQATSRVGRDHNRPGPGRGRAQPAQAARPHAFRAVRALPPQLLSRRRGDERDALGGARAGSRAGGGRRGGGAPCRSEPHAGCRGEGAEEPAGDPRRGARRHRRARAAECGSRRAGPRWQR